MSKSSRKPCARNNGVSLPQPTAVAKAVAAFPDVPPSPLTLVDSTSAVSTSAANEASSEALEKPWDVTPMIEGVSRRQIRQIFDMLHSQSDIVPGTLWHTLPGSLRVRFEGCGITNLRYITKVMQEIGLLRHWGRQAGTTWQVIDASFFEEMIPTHWFERAVYNTGREDKLIDDLYKANERIRKLELEATATPLVSLAPEVSGRATEEPDQALMVQIAGLLDDIEQSEVREKAQNDRIAELERKLAEPPKVTIADVAKYLADRRAGKI